MPSNGTGCDDCPIPPSIASSVLAVDPEIVRIDVLPTTSEDAQTPEIPIEDLPFVKMFRGSANYIANHRNTLAVYHIPGAVVSNQELMQDLMNDITLTWLLGMYVVMVVGCDTQVAQRIDNGEDYRSSTLRVTDDDTLRIVKEEAGYVRFEVERQMARALRQQQQLHMGGNIVSGNFYSAQPLGVQDGIDYKYTGFVRRVEKEKIRRLLHENRDILLLTALGVSPSGEVFNVNSEGLAAACAGALDASKVVYFTEKEMDLRHKIHENRIQSLRLSDARALLDHHGLEINRKGFSIWKDGAADEELDTDQNEMLHKIGWSIRAVEQGVKRAHIISPKHGAVLQELYTRDGSGTLVSGDIYEGIRRAMVVDVSKIHDLIKPLVLMGTLVDRPKATLEKDIDTYHVYTRDSGIVACGQLKQFENGFAEIGCLVVNKEYRSAGRGDAMLGYLERMCVVNGCTSIFVLSTQTMEWFVERGFEEVGVERLPPSRQATYNRKRNSKIYLKKIQSVRDLDESELRWNR